MRIIILLFSLCAFGSVHTEAFCGGVLSQPTLQSQYNLSFPALPHSPASSNFLFIPEITRGLAFCYRDPSFGGWLHKAATTDWRNERSAGYLIVFTWQVCPHCYSLIGGWCVLFLLSIILHLWFTIFLFFLVVIFLIFFIQLILQRLTPVCGLYFKKEAAALWYQFF